MLLGKALLSLFPISLKADLSLPEHHHIQEYGAEGLNQGVGVSNGKESVSCSVMTLL